MLNGQATGIDAAHVQWHAHRGPDEVANGLALCKLHHRAFDKGILGLDDGERICIADVFVPQSDGGLPIESLANRPLAVRARSAGIGFWSGIGRMYFGDGVTHRLDLSRGDVGDWPTGRRLSVSDVCRT